MRSVCFWMLCALTIGAAQAEPPASPQRVLAGAHQQIGITKSYDGGYRKLAYPNGDVPLETGVCSDVVIRAFRHAGVDLQVLVHEDMKRAFVQYPKRWGLRAPDPSIDHRRVPNLATFFTRHGESLPITDSPRNYHAGDIVTWELPGGLPHIGIVDQRTSNGRPMVIHNIGRGTVLEDMLFAFKITGHFRYPRQP